jgi:hypothetical protein
MRFYKSESDSEIFIDTLHYLCPHLQNLFPMIMSVMITFSSESSMEIVGVTQCLEFQACCPSDKAES